MLQLHGPDAPVQIAERIGACAVAGDAAGIETWREIAHRFSQLTSTPGGRIN
jgi:hypothetical protein